MVNAVEDITIFNLRYNSTTRRETFIATNISGVSFYRVAGTTISAAQGIQERRENISYKIRIPINAKVEADRTYIDEAKYAALSDDEAVNYWTLQKGCYILTGSLFVAGEWIWDEFNFCTGVITSAKLDEIQALRQYDSDFVTVTEYANNTRRGSGSVRHWRVGGA